MRNATVRLAVLTAVLFVLSTATAFSFDFSKLEESVSETTLDNGLKIIVMERHDAPVVSCVTYANVGGVDDPKEYTGIAHMLEHMAFKGTTTTGTTDIDKELAAMKIEDSIWLLLRAERKMGLRADSAKLQELEAAFAEAQENAKQYVKDDAWHGLMEEQGAVGINAGTGKDQTSYIMNLPSNKLELWMAMESDRFINPVFREMYQERNVVAEERRQSLENNPVMRAIDAMVSTAFSAHPYGVTIIGHMSDIQNYSRQAVEDYFHKYYVASNLIVAIVGDVKPKEVFKLAEKYWGKLPNRPAPERVATIEPEQKGEKIVTLQDPAQPLFGVAWHVPEYIHPDWPALEAAVDYLGQGRTSLLYKSLVKDNKAASSAGVFLGWPGNKYPCLAFAYGFPNPGVSPDSCVDLTLIEVERLKNELLAPEEVEAIKTRAKAQFVNQLTSNLGMAQNLASYQNDWGDWHMLFKELDRINGVTAEDIQRVAQKYFTKENRTVAKLYTTES
ncbi:MAG TPA: pitrilysin family protein [candidate division Zixibacteria bacterium]|nr:pitrilysin family protein [candidate division Zixibacteria bacterium]